MFVFVLYQNSTEQLYIFSVKLERLDILFILYLGRYVVCKLVCNTNEAFDWGEHLVDVV